jgi:hypothetical protein
VTPFKAGQTSPPSKPFGIQDPSSSNLPTTTSDLLSKSGGQLSLHTPWSIARKAPLCVKTQLSKYRFILLDIPRVASKWVSAVDGVELGWQDRLWIEAIEGSFWSVERMLKGGGAGGEYGFNDAGASHLDGWIGGR